LADKLKTASMAGALENAVYHGQWMLSVSSLSKEANLSKNPGNDSVPNGWAAAARLRVACLIAALFDTMVQYMDSDCDNIEYWRTKFLRSVVQTREYRKTFWRAVIQAALTKLRDKSQLLEQWHKDVHEDTQSPKMTNVQIKSVLKDLLKPSMRAFFHHHVVTDGLQKCAVNFATARNPSARRPLPFLLIVDEAAYLYSANYMHSFSWVLDEPLNDLLCDKDVVPKGERFFVLMLGTHSQISHFTPDQYFPSERYFEYIQTVPSVFLSLPWDSRVEPLSKPSTTLDGSAHIKELVQWGRPIWSSIYDALQKQISDFHSNKSQSDVLELCMAFARSKLNFLSTPSAKRSSNSSEETELAVFAVLAVRLHLDLDFAFPSRASLLVSSAMRWLVDVDQDRSHIVTTYGSEPILAEAAAHLMNSHHFLSGDEDAPFSALLKNLVDQLNQGHVDRGSNGEMTARILCILLL
jgi:hypothetical protein